MLFSSKTLYSKSIEALFANENECHSLNASTELSMVLSIIFFDALVANAIHFPLDALLGRIVPYIIECLKSGNLDKFLKIPAELVYGMQDKAINPQYAIKDFKSLFPNSKVTELKNAGHFSQEDEPEKIISLIKTFVKNN